MSFFYSQNPEYRTTIDYIFYHGIGDNSSSLFNPHENMHRSANSYYEYVDNKDHFGLIAFLSAYHHVNRDIVELVNKIDNRDYDYISKNLVSSESIKNILNSEEYFDYKQKEYDKAYAKELSFLLEFPSVLVSIWELNPKFVISQLKKLVANNVDQRILNFFGGTYLNYKYDQIQLNENDLDFMIEALIKLKNEGTDLASQAALLTILFYSYPIESLNYISKLIDVSDDRISIVNEEFDYYLMEEFDETNIESMIATEDALEYRLTRQEIIDLRKIVAKGDKSR